MIPRKVEWAPVARKDLRSLDHNVRKRIRTTIHRLAETGQGDVKKLQGMENEWRLRVGDWRVRFTLSATNEIVILFVLRVLPRSSAY